MAKEPKYNEETLINKKPIYKVGDIIVYLYTSDDGTDTLEQSKITKAYAFIDEETGEPQWFYKTEHIDEEFAEPIIEEEVLYKI